MSMIQSRRPGKKGKKPCKVDPKILVKILFHYQPPLPSNPTTQKLSQKLFHWRIKLNKFSAKKKIIKNNNNNNNKIQNK